VYIVGAPLWLPPAVMLCCAAQRLSWSKTASTSIACDCNMDAESYAMGPWITAECLSACCLQKMDESTTQTRKVRCQTGGDLQANCKQTARTLRLPPVD
jgi:hypothetical protein